MGDQATSTAAAGTQPLSSSRPKEQSASAAAAGVGAAVETLDAVVDGVAGGRHENGRRVASGADLLENLKAVLAGQAQIGT